MTTIPPLPQTPPADILDAAADHIQRLAAAATAGTWMAKDMTSHGHPGVWWVESIHTDEEGTTWGNVADLETVNSANDAHWIEALSPEIMAPGLDRMLRQASRELRQAWALFEPGSTRFVLLTGEDGLHNGDADTTVWTEQSRWEAIQPRWGGAIDLAQRILATTTRAAPDPQG